MENRSCGSCAFFEKAEGILGACHYDPPYSRDGFPVITQKDWCSHFSKEWPAQEIPKKGWK